MTNETVIEINDGERVKRSSHHEDCKIINIRSGGYLGIASSPDDFDQYAEINIYGGGVCHVAYSGSIVNVYPGGVLKSAHFGAIVNLHKGGSILKYAGGTIIKNID